MRPSVDSSARPFSSDATSNRTFVFASWSGASEYSSTYPTMLSLASPGVAAGRDVDSRDFRGSAIIRSPNFTCPAVPRAALNVCSRLPLVPSGVSTASLSVYEPGSTSVAAV